MVYLYIYGEMIIMLNGNPPLARYVGHVILVLSVKWAYTSYENPWGRPDSILNMEMICYVGYSMVDIIDGTILGG